MKIEVPLLAVAVVTRGLLLGPRSVESIGQWFDQHDNTTAVAVTIDLSDALLLTTYETQRSALSPHELRFRQQ